MTDQNDTNLPPELLTDVPKTSAIVTTRQEAKALARSMFGDDQPGRMRFICVACGWDKTLEFDEAEIAALGGDISEYSGPCGICDCQMLVPHGSILAGTNIAEAAQKSFYKQVDDASDLVLDKVESRIADFMTGGGAKKPDAAAPAAAAPAGGPITRDDLPDADTVGKK
jgi:hypothetical protein